VARISSGDRFVGSTSDSIDRQQESVAASRALEDEQTLADDEQTLADSEQVAADRGQAAGDRDLAAGGNPPHEFSREVREHTGDQPEQTVLARLDPARERDATAHARDLAALARDQAADVRDLVAAQRDDVDEQHASVRAVTGSDIVIRSSRQYKRAHWHRAEHSERRALAARDRQAAARDREQDAGDRSHAAEDRSELKRQLASIGTDPLTGARTHAAGLTDLDHELERCGKTGVPLVLAYIDAVGLHVPDDSTHAAGDDLLKHVVALMKTHLRPYDLIVRLGGNEFLCAMSNMTLVDARKRFSAIAAELAACPDAAAVRISFADLTSNETAAESRSSA
jgi:diguanylate cyclase (GGDEF)-like protein